MFRNLIITLAAILMCGCHAFKKDSEHVVVAYVTSWTDEMPDPFVMTHINYAFGHVNDTFDGVRVDNPSRLESLVALKAKNPELNVMLSIGVTQQDINDIRSNMLK